MKPTDTYHHGHLREELLRLGLKALETEGAEQISLRLLAERAGVSKTAPYRHFDDREAFMGALADEGFRLLCIALEHAGGSGSEKVSAMGKAYMDFAITHPALYRLMNSPLVCRMPDELMTWPRKSLVLLATSLAEASSRKEGDGGIDINATVAAWGYIHGIVLIRIDGLFPGDLPEPDWDRLASVIPVLG